LSASELKNCAAMMVPKPRFMIMTQRLASGAGCASLWAAAGCNRGLDRERL
jgi:hypothetical protein